MSYGIFSSTGAGCLGGTRLVFGGAGVAVVVDAFGIVEVRVGFGSAVVLVTVGLSVVVVVGLVVVVVVGFGFGVVVVVVVVVGLFVVVVVVVVVGLRVVVVVVVVVLGVVTLGFALTTGFVVVEATVGSLMEASRPAPS